MFLRLLTLAASALDATSAFMERLLPFRDRLYRLALAQLRNTSDAEDAVQDTLIKAGKSAPIFRNESSEYTWVVRILINQCHDMQRSRERRQKREVSDSITGSAADTVADFRKRPEEYVELSDISKHLMNAVDELSTTHRPLILMRYFEQMSYEEIAQSLEIHLGTVKSRMNQAKTLLRAALERRGIGEDVL